MLENRLNRIKKIVEYTARAIQALADTVDRDYKK